MKELKIGEEIRIRCVKSNSVQPIPDCNKCCFNGVCDTTVMKCQEWKRSDGNNVHFEIVNADHFPDATKMVLTWQDVNKILSASENLSDEIKSGETPEVANLEDYCTEVLRRFKEGNQ